MKSSDTSDTIQHQVQQIVDILIERMYFLVNENKIEEAKALHEEIKDWIFDDSSKSYMDIFSITLD